MCVELTTAPIARGPYGSLRASELAERRGYGT